MVAAGGIGGLLGALSTRLLVRTAGPVPAIVISCALSGAALIMIAAAPAASVLLVANLIYTWAIIAASVTMRALRQVLVPRELLGRVTSSWRLGGQGVTLVGGVLAAAAAGLFGGDPRPVFAIAGSVTLLTVGRRVAGWPAAVRNRGCLGRSARLVAGALTDAPQAGARSRPGSQCQ